MNNLEAENEKLKAQLNKAKRDNRQLKKYIQEQEDQFPLRVFEYIENITHDYSILLHPYPVNIKASDKGNMGVFEFKVTDVICVEADDRLKKIYLRRKIADIEGRTMPQSLITVNRNKLTIEQLRQEIDSRSYHLVQVGRGLLVNTMYYKPKLSGVELTLQNITHADIANFNIAEEYLKVFVQKRNELVKIVSLHKSLVRYINTSKAD